MESKRSILASIILAVVALLILGATMMQKSSGTNNLSPEAAYLTEPVTSFSGTVEKVEKNSITVSRKAQVTLGSMVSITPFPERTLTYRIAINPNTRFSRVVMPADYETKTGISLRNSPPSAADLKKGQTITVLTSSDLRFLKTNAFDAATIELPPIQKLIAGQFLKIESDQIVLSSIISAHTTPLVPLPEESMRETRSVRISSDTRIVKNTFSNDPAAAPKPVSVSVSSIPSGTQLFVYLKDEAGNKIPTAAYIEYSDYSPITPALPAASLTGMPLPQTGTPVIPTSLPTSNL